MATLVTFDSLILKWEKLIDKDTDLENTTDEVKNVFHRWVYLNRFAATEGAPFAPIDNYYVSIVNIAATDRWGLNHEEFIPILDKILGSYAESIEKGEVVPAFITDFLRAVCAEIFDDIAREYFPPEEETDIN